MAGFTSSEPEQIKELEQRGTTIPQTRCQRPVKNWKGETRERMPETKIESYEMNDTPIGREERTRLVVV
jgi:hypothetical protein